MSGESHGLQGPAQNVGVQVKMIEVWMSQVGGRRWERGRGGGIEGRGHAGSREQEGKGSREGGGSGEGTREVLGG